ncbi:MAG: ParB/RepB/Spo0J family partition protein [Streptosporangiales bacterium]|nr:ParB/RepB/Spo0J family partition protein [Streptosporangiales bacterium]
MTITASDLYQRPRDPRDEQRLQELADKLIAKGTVSPDNAPATASEPRATPPARAGQPDEIPVDRVLPHPGNIRTELGDLEEMAASMRAHGVLQPLTVQPAPGKPGQVRILAGHRRLAAAKAAGLRTVPVIVREPDGEPEELMLIENCHRRDLSVMDKAEAMGTLLDKGYNAAKIARTTGFSESTVSSYTALLELDDRTRDMVRDGRLRAADALAGVRAARKKRRKREGKAEMSPVWEPDYLTGTHPLARKAHQLCNAREHTQRRRIGRVACGQCWETVIRQDERIAEASRASDT